MEKFVTESDITGREMVIYRGGKYKSFKVLQLQLALVFSIVSNIYVSMNMQIIQLPQVSCSLCLHAASCTILWMVPLMSAS